MCRGPAVDNRLCVQYLQEYHNEELNLHLIREYWGPLRLLRQVDLTLTPRFASHVSVTVVKYNDRNARAVEEFCSNAVCAAKLNPGSLTFAAHYDGVIAAALSLRKFTTCSEDLYSVDLYSYDEATGPSGFADAIRRCCVQSGDALFVTQLSECHHRRRNGIIEQCWSHALPAQAQASSERRTGSSTAKTPCNALGFQAKPRAVALGLQCPGSALDGHAFVCAWSEANAAPMYGQDPTDAALTCGRGRRKHEYRNTSWMLPQPSPPTDAAAPPPADAAPPPDPPALLPDPPTVVCRRTVHSVVRANASAAWLSRRGWQAIRGLHFRENTGP